MAAGRREGIDRGQGAAAFAGLQPVSLCIGPKPFLWSGVQLKGASPFSPGHFDRPTAAIGPMTEMDAFQSRPDEDGWPIAPFEQPQTTTVHGAATWRNRRKTQRISRRPFRWN
jgi:hypothetical protein